MISESVIIFGVTGNIVMVLNGELPKDAPIMFRINNNSLDIIADNDVLYHEDGLSPHTCERLKAKNEIGLMEVVNQSTPPSKITNIAYQAA